jgi:hypothetical protein
VNRQQDLVTLLTTLRRPTGTASHCGLLARTACRIEAQEMVGETGFEPATLCSQSRCATRLRYSPTVRS